MKHAGSPRITAPPLQVAAQSAPRAVAALNRQSVSFDRTTSGVPQPAPFYRIQSPPPRQQAQLFLAIGNPLGRFAKQDPCILKPSTVKQCFFLVQPVKQARIKHWSLRRRIGKRMIQCIRYRYLSMKCLQPRARPLSALMFVVSHRPPFYDSPTTRPSSSMSIFIKPGVAGKPGMVRISPQRG